MSITHDPREQSQEPGDRTRSEHDGTGRTGPLRRSQGEVA